MRVLGDVLNMTKYVLVGGKLFHMHWDCYVHITNLLVQLALVRLFGLLIVLGTILNTRKNSTLPPLSLGPFSISPLK